MDLQNEVMVFDSSSRAFSSEIQQIRQLADGEVLVRVRSCTVCGSDLHTFTGRRAGPARCVLGHEIIGTIHDWGGESPPRDYWGNPVQPGQRVTWNMAVGCGHCFYCRRNLQQKCESLFKYGHQFDDERVATGGLAEYCRLVAGTSIFPVPDSLPDAVATPANCATATVCAATRLVKETHPFQGASALVIGLGMLGLTGCSWTSDYGASSVVALDPDPGRRSLAGQFGATHVVADENELAGLVDSQTAGRGFDVVFDFAGVTSAVQAAIQNVRTGGCVLLAGSVFPGEQISLAPESLVRRMITLRGLHNYLPRDLESALSFLERTHTRFPFAQLVSESFSRSETTKAFQYANEHRPVRVAIVDP